MNDILTLFGLSGQEAALYRSVLQSGAITVTELARNAGMNRTTLYPYIDHLKKLGLIKIHKSGRETSIVPEDPRSSLSAIVDEQASMIEQQREALDTLPKILTRKLKTSSNQSMFELSGKMALRKALQDILNMKADIYWYGSMKTILDFFREKDFYRFFSLPRMKANTKAFALTDEHLLSHKRFSEQLGQFRNYKVVSKDLNIPAMLVICKDYVYILKNHAGTPRMIVIQDQTVSDLILSLFNDLWKRT